MPKGWRWECQGAERVERRGRAKGGIITEVREEIATKGGEETKEEGVQERRAKLGETTWRIVTIYNRGGCTEKIKKIEETIGEEEEEGKMIIGGDFNARIGEKGYREEGEERGSIKRKTKDRKENKEGEELIEMTRGRGWTILNGNMRGGEEGEITYNKSGAATTIDYGIVTEETWEMIESFKVEKRIESDHQPIIVQIRGGEIEKGEKEEEEREVQIWGKKETERFREKMEETRWEKEGVEEKWRELTEKIEKTIKKKKIKPWKIGKTE